MRSHIVTYFSALIFLDATFSLCFHLPHGSFFPLPCPFAQVEEGDIYFCIQYPGFDGHQYIEAALDAGAAAIMVEDEGCMVEARDIVPESIPLIKVPDMQVTQG